MIISKIRPKLCGECENHEASVLVKIGKKPAFLCMECLEDLKASFSLVSIEEITRSISYFSLDGVRLEAQNFVSEKDSTL